MLEGSTVFLYWSVSRLRSHIQSFKLIPYPRHCIWKSHVLSNIVLHRFELELLIAGVVIISSTLVAWSSSSYLDFVDNCHRAIVYGKLDCRQLVDYKAVQSRVLAMETNYYHHSSVYRYHCHHHQ